MRELSKKLGSVTLGVGALALVLVNAAMTHGCARSSTAQITPRSGPPSAGAEPPASEGTTAVGEGSADPKCTPPAYMYATKAPIWVPPECYGGTSTPTPSPQQMPSPPTNAQQQAP